MLSVLKLVAILLISHTLRGEVAAQFPKSLPHGPLLPFPVQDIKQCWSSLESVNGCLSEIYASLINGRVGSIGHSCCQAITNVTTNCWHEMFPYNQDFPPLLMELCAANGVLKTKPVPHIPTPSALEPRGFSAVVASSSTETSDAQPDFPPLPSFPLGSTSSIFDPSVPGKCLQSLENNQGCIEEVITSFFSFQVGLLGPRCCRVIVSIDDTCLPKMFPLNPFFSPLIKNYCANLAHQTPNHTPMY